MAPRSLTLIPARSQCTRSNRKIFAVFGEKLTPFTAIYIQLYFTKMAVQAVKRNEKERKTN
jgi:hypothetical protein